MPTPVAPASMHQLAALLRQDQVDAAIDAGLMSLDLAQAADGQDLLEVSMARTRLQRAWAARARYRARETRLARAAASQRGGRPASPTCAPSPTPAPVAPPTPGLPAAAAAALARAQARAQGRTGE